MTSDNPQETIKVKALGLHWRNDCLLAFEVLDQAGKIKGVRPLGGTIEFGESWEDALVREFQEELGTTVRISGVPITMESLFEDGGIAGHEVLFIADVIFLDDAFMSQDVIQFKESDGTLFTARWFDLNDLDGDGPALFPTGLKELLQRRR